MYNKKLGILKKENEFTTHLILYYNIFMRPKRDLFSY